MAESAISLPKGVTIPNVIEKLRAEKRAAFEYQKRRHGQWDENYFLYRDKVQINRLTQRQAVNIPIMKETVRTILPKIDEKPDLAFIDKAGDLEREIAINAKWDDDCDTNNVELLDLADKKQVMLYGRSFTKLNWINGEVVFELKDIYDFLPDRNTNPLDIETARYIIEPHIFKPLEEILTNDRYDQKGRDKLKEKIDRQGKKQNQARSAENQAMAKARENRLVGVGVKADIENYEQYQQLEELVQHYTHLWDKEKKQYVRYIILMSTADVMLRAKPLKEEMGVDFWPAEGWADDVEITDIWSDSMADMIRVPNQVLNIWFSQFLENRTLKNFGMNYYDSTIEGFEPSKFQPRPGGWYPLPGKPADVYQRVDVPDLTGTIDEMNFLVGVAERATATGAIEKGVVEQAKRTLGEIEIAVGKAEERTTSMSKFYRLSWRRKGEKWYKLQEANLRDEKKRLYKRSPSGEMIGKDFTRDELISPVGVKVVATSANQKSSDQVDKIQRLMAVKAEMPNNPPLQKAIQKRMLNIADLTPEEIQEIESYQEQQPPTPPAMPGQAPATPPSTGANKIDQMLQGAGINPQPAAA